MSSIEAMKMALQSLDIIRASCSAGRMVHAENEAAIAEHILRQAIEQTEKQETRPCKVDGECVLSDNVLCACRQLQPSTNSVVTQPEQEPVAWMHNAIEGNVITHIPADIGRHPERWTPLYTEPCQTCQSLAMAVMNDQTYHEKVIPKREWVGLTDEEIDALSQARSLTDELMDCVDRLGSEADTVDPRVWQHLLVYAPKPEEEPVAWISEGGDVSRSKRYMDEMGFKCNPLYTAPPKREWVGLTDEERRQILLDDPIDWIAAIEAKLKEKNHG